MFNHAPEDYNCPFCNILNDRTNKDGSGPQDIFYKDEFLRAFVGAKWWPNNAGSTIIIPNKHYENIYELPNDLGHKIFDLSKQIAIALKEIYKCDGVSTRQHNEEAGNQHVWHYHFHVIPRYTGDDLYINHENYKWVTVQDRAPYVENLKDYFKKTNLSNP